MYHAQASGFPLTSKYAYAQLLRISLEEEEYSGCADQPAAGERSQYLYIVALEHTEQNL